MTGMIATFTVLLILPAGNPEPQPPTAPSIRHTLATLDYSAVPVSLGSQATTPSTPEPRPTRSIRRRIGGGIAGAVFGFIAGAYTWELLTRDCSNACGSSTLTRRRACCSFP